MQIGVIAEGASELLILKHLIGRYLGVEHNVNEIQPKTKPDGTQDGEGGWARVIATFEHEGTIEHALVENDYVLIQIDTDQAQTSPYSVSVLDDKGECCTPNVLYDRVRNRILDHIPHLTEQQRSKILLAICINEIECWLLPVYYHDAKRCKTSNCVALLNKELQNNKIRPLSDGNKNSLSARKTYQAILKNLKKPKDIKSYAQYNHGFKCLVEQFDYIVSNMEFTDGLQ